MSVQENPEVDTYLIDGCGRCALYKTPECKVHAWQEELKALRKIVLSCQLKEDYKWSQPCYTWKGSNVLIVTAFKYYACISFFKGALLSDPERILVKPGKSSQAARQIRYRDVDTIRDQEEVLTEYIQKAIELEKSGKKVAFKKNPEAPPAELLQKFKEDPGFKAAFESLTPGRQRGYILYFSQPKQSATRVRRIEKYMPRIFDGEGIHDGYKSGKK